MNTARVEPDPGRDVICEAAASSQRGASSPDVTLAIVSGFIATDLDAGASVRGADLKPPYPQDGAFALWSMAVNTCRDRFPEGAIEQGPSSFDGAEASGSS